MDSENLIKEIELVFPFVERPKGIQVSFHKVDCYQCLYLRQEMERYPGTELPKEALRYLHNELSCLSAKGWAWVLPSYLRYCVTADETYDGMETEFLIYNLSPDLKFQKETMQRLSLLNREQITCLIHFIEWCEEHEHWSNYCPKEIIRAKHFLLSINA